MFWALLSYIEQAYSISNNTGIISAIKRSHIHNEQLIN